MKLILLASCSIPFATLTLWLWYFCIEMYAKYYYQSGKAASSNIIWYILYDYSDLCILHGLGMVHGFFTKETNYYQNQWNKNYRRKFIQALLTLRFGEFTHVLINKIYNSSQIESLIPKPWTQIDTLDFESEFFITNYRKMKSIQLFYNKQWNKIRQVFRYIAKQKYLQVNKRHVQMMVTSILVIGLTAVFSFWVNSRLHLEL